MNVVLLTGSKKTLIIHACIINVFLIDGQHKHINYARVHNQRRFADCQQKDINYARVHDECPFADRQQKDINHARVHNQGFFY